MGGTKKKPISKIEKRQLKEREKAKKKEEKVQKVVREFLVDDDLRTVSYTHLTLPTN